MTPQFPDALTQTVHLFREIAKQDVSHPFLCRTTHGKRTDENRLPVTAYSIPPVVTATTPVPHLVSNS
jgi:hypothetical protein